MVETQLVEDIVELLKTIKKYDDKKIVFSKVFSKYAEGATPSIYNKVYNPATMYFLGWSRAALYIEDISTALHTFDKTTLNEIYIQLRSILELL
jgi:hypothetical protein